MRKKKERRPRRKRLFRYKAADVRIEDAGPHPKGPIIGYNPARSNKTLGGAEAPPDTAVTSPSNENSL